MTEQMAGQTGHTKSPPLFSPYGENGISSEKEDVMSITVKTDPILEAIARKLHGFGRVPPEEQNKMIARAVDAAREAAAARIVELEQQLAAAQERERWIPVTERLPEKDGYYLAFVSGWEHAWQCEFASPWWYDCPDEPPITPTHWCELPTPPEADHA